MTKFLRIVFYIFLSITMLMMLISSYSSWKDQQAFSNGVKEKATATIKIDKHNVKTYNYQGNDYGIDASKSVWMNGDKVTIYFLKDRPYIV